MSNRLISEVYKREVGNLTRTAIMALMADKADYAGAGIWASKQHLADAVGASKQTIIRGVQSLIDDGLLQVIGRRPCSNGYTVEYAIDVEALGSLPLVPSHRGDRSQKVASQIDLPDTESDPTSPNVLPDRSQSVTGQVTESDPNHPITHHNPPDPMRVARNSRRSIAKVPMTEDWQPASLPPDICRLVDQWPEGRFGREVMEFREYWIEQGTKRPGWDRTFRSRINGIHDRIMREITTGGRRLNSASRAVGSDTEGFLRRCERYTANRPRSAKA